MGLGLPPPFENVFSPQTSLFQQETTAANENAKQLVNLNTDTLLPFILIGKEGLWETTSDPSRPTLPPTGRARTSSSEDDQQLDYHSFADKILKSLPQDVANALRMLSNLPPESRNSEATPNYDLLKSLEQAVKLTAQTELFITYASSLSKSENAQNAALINSELPGIVSGNMVVESEKIAEMHREEARRRDREPSHDAMSQVLSDLGDVVAGLSQALALSPSGLGKK